MHAQLPLFWADSLLIAGSKRPSKKDQQQEQRQAYDAEVLFLSPPCMHPQVACSNAGWAAQVVTSF